MSGQMGTGEYKTIESVSTGNYREKGSRFLASAFPVTGVEEIRALLEGIRKEYHDARHHCYAYMLGSDRQTWRVSDDGEPSGTAGRPILGQINSAGLTNILIVVSRYFGGTLLGVSGLINAYRSAAADAISNAVIAERTLHDYYEIVFPYNSLNDIMKILKEEGAGQSGHSIDLQSSIVIDFSVAGTEKIIGRLSRIEGLRYTFIQTK